MKSTPDQTFDTCIKCGKKIRYDKGDGYWDNLTKQKDGTSLWTPFNCVNETTTHEPTNHTPDDKGYYHPIVGKKKIKVSRTGRTYGTENQGLHKPACYGVGLRP